MQLFQEGVFLYVFRNFYENLFCRTCPNRCLSEMNQKTVFTKSINSKIVIFSAVADMWAYSFSKKGLHHRFFSMKIGKFNRASILQNDSARLLLISGDIFNVLLALSVINQFSQNMEI